MALGGRRQFDFPDLVTRSDVAIVLGRVINNTGVDAIGLERDGRGDAVLSVDGEVRCLKFVRPLELGADQHGSVNSQVDNVDVNSLEDEGSGQAWGQKRFEIDDGTGHSLGQCDFVREVCYF